MGNNGQSITLGYDGNSNVKTRTDAQGRSTLFDYDALGRLIRTQLPDGGIIRQGYGYASTGPMTTVTDPRGLVTTTYYNAFGQVIKLVSPDTGTTNFVYDAAGRLQLRTTHDGRQTSYVWDKADRLILRTSGSSVETFTYDEGPYGTGRLTRLNDASGQTSYTYEADGQLKSISTHGGTYTIAYNRDAIGRLSSIAYPGTTVGYEYDGVGRISRVTTSVPSWPVLADGFLYQGVSQQPYAWRLGNARLRGIEFDRDRRTTRKASPGVHDVSLGYNTTDTIASLTDSLWTQQSSTLAYDANDRLRTVLGVIDSQTVVPDLTGNRSSHTRGGTVYSWTVEPTSNRVRVVQGSNGSSRGYDYDLVGNLQYENGNGMALVYEYDAFNRLQTLRNQGATIGTYTSNALNQRTTKTAQGLTTDFVHAPDGTLLYENRAGVTTALCAFASAKATHHTADGRLPAFLIASFDIALIDGFLRPASIPAM